MTKKTLERAIKYHKELWNWLVDNPGVHKDEWPGWDKYDNKLVGGEWYNCGAYNANYCFACAIADILYAEHEGGYKFGKGEDGSGTFTGLRCRFCPFSHHPSDISGTCISLWDKWLGNQQAIGQRQVLSCKPPTKLMLKRAASYATQIRDLSWKIPEFADAADVDRK